MKRILLLLAPVLLLAVMASCTKEGPQGPVGPEGPTGPEGPQGESGEVTCNQCHTESEDMMIKSKEWSMSNHATNTFLADRGGDYGGGSCNMCHSSQGFQDHIATGNTAGVLENPLNPNCYTCHKIHDTYTSADWEMRKTDAVDMLIGGSHDFSGANNTCASCHQARSGRGENPMWETGEHSITGHKGPHYGATGAAMAGVGKSGAYELAGSKSYENGAHASASCTSCHMAKPGTTKFELGGHTKNASIGSWEDDSKVVNSNACVSCHSWADTNEAATSGIKGIRDTNKPLFEALEASLIAKNVLVPDGNGGHTQTTLPVPATLAQAFYNYEFVYYEHTYGVHNPKYINALLVNTKEVVDAQTAMPLPTAKK